MGLDCGITLVHNVSFLGKDCRDNSVISQIVQQLKTDICVSMEDGYAQNQPLEGQLILEPQQHDIDVNCSQPLMMTRSNGSTQAGGTEVEATTVHATSPSTPSGTYVAIAVVGGVLVCIVVVAWILICRKRKNYSAFFTALVNASNQHIIVHVDIQVNQEETSVPIEDGCADREDHCIWSSNLYYDHASKERNHDNISESQSTDTVENNTPAQYNQGNKVDGGYEDVDYSARNLVNIPESQSMDTSDVLELHSQSNDVDGDYEDVDNRVRNKGDTSESQSTDTPDALEQYNQQREVGGGYEDVEKTIENQRDISESHPDAQEQYNKVHGGGGDYEDIEPVSESPSRDTSDALELNSQNNGVGGDYEVIEYTPNTREQPIRNRIQHETISAGEDNDSQASILKPCS